MSGIIGVYSTKNENVTDSLVYGLFATQNRGENGCGVAFAKHGITIRRRFKLVGEMFTEKPSEWGTTYYEFLRDVRQPYAAIGHTLYEKSSDLQPTERENDKYHIALAMDGSILGFEKPNDCVMADFFFKALNDTNSEEKAAAKVMETLDDCGFYNVVALVQKRKNDVKLVAFRDPRGGKPLSLGKRGNSYIVVSETQGLNGAKALFIKDIEPGSVYVFDGGGYRSQQIIQKPHAHCIFELIYFAAPGSVIEGKSVYETRKNLGRCLVRRYDYRPDVFCPSPDSGRGCGKGCSEESGIPLEEYITKNPGAPRTFQIEDPVQRMLAALSKFNVDLAVKDMNVGVTEDSIVRGTVIKIGTTDKIKACGAKEATVWVSYAPMPFRCYRSDGKERMAARGLSSNAVELAGRVVAQRLGVDGVFYNNIKDVQEICGLDDACMACATGNYYYVKSHMLRFSPDS